MLQIVTDPHLAAEARVRVKTALDGDVDIADAWLAAVLGVALLEETGHAPDDDQALRLEQALKGCGVVDLIGVATEDLNGTDEVYRLQATRSDLNEFAWARFGMNYVLMPVSGLDLIVLCTVRDYLLVAGPEGFVADYAEDPAAVAQEFREFISGDPDWQGLDAQRLLRHLRWAEGPSGA